MVRRLLPRPSPGQRTDPVQDASIIPSPENNRRTVQLTQVAERSLARSVHCSYRLYQRPVDVILTVFRAVVRSQEHLAPIMSSHPYLFKIVGLHYTPFSHAPIANTILPSHQTSKFREFNASMTNLG